MKRLLTHTALVLLGLVIAGATAAQTVARPGQDPAFCRSMCASEQNACRADARVQPQEERLAANDPADRNPFARTAQGQVPRTDMRALDAVGDENRKQQRLGACDATYQRCTRGCATAAPSNTGGR